MGRSDLLQLVPPQMPEYRHYHLNLLNTHSFHAHKLPAKNKFQNAQFIINNCPGNWQTRGTSDLGLGLNFSQIAFPLHTHFSNSYKSDHRPQIHPWNSYESEIAELKLPIPFQSDRIPITHSNTPNSEIHTNLS